MDYNLGNIACFENFRRDAKGIFISTLEMFFSASVEIYEYPLNQVKKHNIDILKTPKRVVYYLDDNRILLVPHLYKGKEIIAYLGILLEKKGLGYSKKIFNVLGDTLVKNLTRALIFNFREPIQIIDNNLLIRVIANYFSKGRYNPNRIMFLIEFMNKLRTTSFEGKYFSTGMILTKANYSYRGIYKDYRFGEAISLTRKYSLNTQKIDRRFWFLVDGKNSFYLCNRKFDITHFFCLDEELKQNTYLNNLTLSNTLKGGDVLFRVENEKEFSIITSDGIEFNYNENHWRFRDFSALKKLLLNYAVFPEDIFDSLLFYLFHCSKKAISCIVWIPDDFRRVDNLLKVKNRLFRKKLNISSKKYTNNIIRLLSSDGATVIDNEGFFRYYGCIVDMARVNISGVKGTGESAASILADNGIAIKVSQDGTIKLFVKQNSNAIAV